MRDPTEFDAAQWRLAREREGVIRPLAEGEARPLDVARAAQRLGLSARQVYTLLGRYRRAPGVSALAPRPQGRPLGVRRLDDAVEAIVAERIAKAYAVRRKPSLSALVRAVAHECRRAGLAAPAWNTVARRVRDLDPAAMAAAREGREAARSRFGASKGSIATSRPLERVQIDHAFVDVQVVDRLFRRAVGRPWLTLAIDVHTRMAVGYHLTLEAPSALSVALCLSHAVRAKPAVALPSGTSVDWPVFGRPERLCLDNAPEFHGEALTRGCEDSGIAVEHRPIRTPHYGGHIERLIGTMMGAAHLLPGTTFSNVAARGAYDSAGCAALTLAELDAWMALQIAGVYHLDLHRGIGRPPLACWREALAKGFRPTSIADPARFERLLMPIAWRTARRDGLHLFNIAYWHDLLPGIAARTRERLMVRYDPRDLSRIWLRLPSDELVELGYKDLRRPPIALWEHRAALAAARLKGRAQVDEERLFATVEAQRELVARAEGRTRQARRQAERGASCQGRAPLDAAAVDYAAAPAILPVEEW
jgi:putative transposase